jgi:GNAT superfamily N-acetyltransferase
MREHLGKPLRLHDFEAMFKPPADHHVRWQHFDAHGPALHVNGHIHNAEGEDVASFGRSFVKDSGDEPSDAHHEHLFVEDEHQGKGIGSEFLRNSLRGYQKHGIQKVHVSTDDKGNYVWASMGFDWSPAELQRKKWELERYLQAHAPGFNAEAIANGMKHSWDFAKLHINGWHAGKDFLLDHAEGWNGKLHIGDPNHPTYKRAKAILRF